jgi:NOL1/NOP2/fmu family ribosome biogenesis protein
MVVDAPCSGSGLFRRDEDAIDEWSLNNVQLCCQRQKRILADALPALREDGILIYSTCSYSQEEDEDIADWLIDEFDMESCSLQINPGWKIIESVSPANGASCYRFYPDKLKGEGFFLACLRKKLAAKKPRINSAKPEKISAREVSVIQPWLRSAGSEIMKENNFYYALPENLVADYYILRSVLNIRYRGVQLGAIMKEKLVPDHALALNNLVSEQIPVNELNYDQAIKYLQKQDVNFNSSGKGFQLVSYKGEQLGWINVLPGRVNNYYPKEIRFLKQSNDASFEK